jgi:hypothetical protein
MVDDAGNPASPVKWFARDTPFACLAPVFMYDTEWTLPADGTATFRYRMYFADGALDRDRIERMVKEG